MTAAVSRQKIYDDILSQFTEFCTSEYEVFRLKGQTTSKLKQLTLKACSEGSEKHTETASEIGIQFSDISLQICLS